MQNSKVLVTDSIDCKRSMSPKNLYFMESIDDRGTELTEISERLTDLGDKMKHLEIEKTYNLEKIWNLSQISAKWQ